MTGIVPGSAAERAGLRDGMRLGFFRVDYGAVEPIVDLRVVEGERLRAVEYAPRANRQVGMYAYQPLPGAARKPACRSWIEAR